METMFYQETTRKRSHLKEGAEKMQEQTQIGDKMKFDLDIGESGMLEVTAVVREKFPHVVYMEYKGRGGKWRPLSMSWIKLRMECRGWTAGKN